jgi:hypothetical protein
MNHVWELIPRDVEPRRGILHWTGGGPRASSFDRRHYHFLFEQPEGRVIPGDLPVSANMRRVPTDPSQYAAHTGGFNSWSAGFSFCGMLSAQPGFRHGQWPLGNTQLREGFRFIAACYYVWRLDPSNPAHLFTHSEAWTLHGVKGVSNHQKWDINELLIMRGLSPSETGPWIRQRVRHHLNDQIPALKKFFGNR